MKLLTIDEGGGSPGVVLGNGDVLNLSSVSENMLESGWRPGSVREILEQGDQGLGRVRHIIDAAEKGANIILLQELFQTPYFCIQYDEKIFHLAKTFENNKVLNEMSQIAKKLKVVLPISFFE